MVDRKLEIDEAQRAANYESVKSEIEAGVNADLAARADSRRTVEQQRYIEEVADELRAKAVTEVGETEREVERGRALARVSQVVDYCFFLLYGLLTIRLLLELFNARESVGFVKLINAVTNPFYAPFRGIVAEPSRDGFTLALSIVIAIVVYMLLHFAVNGLLRLFAHRKTAV